MLSFFACGQLMVTRVKGQLVETIGFDEVDAFWRCCYKHVACVIIPGGHLATADYPQRQLLWNVNCKGKGRLIIS